MRWMGGAPDWGREATTGAELSIRSWGAKAPGRRCGRSKPCLRSQWSLSVDGIDTLFIQLPIENADQILYDVRLVSALE